MTTDINNHQDIIDSRDVIARIEELQEERQALADAVDDAKEALTPTEEEKDADETDPDALEHFEEAEAALKEWDESEEAQELKTLEALQDEADGYCSDWKHGAALIRDSYFQDYAQQTAEDLGLMANCNQWPATCIDWERAAEELQQDYTSVDFDGVTYWIR